MRPVTADRFDRLVFTSEPDDVIVSRFSSSPRAVATMRGISAVASPRSTVRVEPAGSGASVSTPV